MTDTGITQEHVDIVERAGNVLEQLTTALVEERRKVARLAAMLKTLAFTCENDAYSIQDEDGNRVNVVHYIDIQPLLKASFELLAQEEKK